MAVSESKNTLTFSISVIDYTKPVYHFFGTVGHETKQIDIEARSREEAVQKAKALGYTPTVWLM